jgi:2-dehydro-3-deoxyphosphogluconate aldolase/(4S)-4-hydroxy-2-oxoglutarate aldolase
MDEITRQIAAYRLVPIIVIEDADDAEPLGKALKAGGLACAEVTLRTAAAEEAIRRLAMDGDILLGAGTVLRPDQVDRAVEMGARYIVTPGFSAAVVDRCQHRGVPVFPGVATATEIQMALEAGLDTVKFFPAETAGGPSALRAMSQPFGTMRFIPTGGITPVSLASYLALTSVLAVGGSWMASPRLIASRDFAEITRLTAEAVALARAST